MARLAELNKQFPSPVAVTGIIHLTFGGIIQQETLSTWISLKCEVKFKSPTPKAEFAPHLLFRIVENRCTQLPNVADLDMPFDRQMLHSLSLCPVS